MNSHTQMKFAPAGDLHTSSTSDRYQNEYIAAFVEKWDELIDWDRRAAAEGNFFIDQLRASSAKSVLDVATGTGFHSIRLLRAGFDVTSADGSERMLGRAELNAHRHALRLRPVHADWRWLSREVAGPFDAVICLGNSFTHLFREADRRLALSEFFSMLKPGGLLIIDQRNYDSLLDSGSAPGNRTYYCGLDVRVRPTQVDSSIARFRYEFADGAIYHLDMFPIRKNYLRQLLVDAGFDQIRTFSDFRAVGSNETPDFYIHIGTKPIQTANDRT